VVTGHHPTVAEVLEFCQLEPDGLTPDHIRYLLALEDQFRPVGLAGLVNILRRPAGIVENLEKLLIEHLRYVDPSVRGRVLTPLGARRAMELRRAS
jgi:Holliday junction resolvasome RuvABC ATP-dependent DNA helicase subunit